MAKNKVSVCLVNMWLQNAGCPAVEEVEHFQDYKFNFYQYNT